MFIIKVVAGIDKPHTGVFSAHHFEISGVLTIHREPLVEENTIEVPLLPKDTVYVMDSAGNTLDTIKILED